MESVHIKRKSVQVIIHDDQIDHADFVTHLKHISTIHYFATRKDLDRDAARVAIDDFLEHWDQMRDKFDLSETLKLHIIKHHLMDYFELTGEALLSVTDEVTEAVHSALRFHDEAHGYTINMKGSPMHMKQQHRSSVSFNSRNLGDV